MGRIYKTPMLLRTCTIRGCNLGADFTLKNDALTPIGFICAKHAFLLKVGGAVVDMSNEERAKRQKEFLIEDGDEVALPGEDDDGKRTN